MHLILTENKDAMEKRTLTLDCSSCKGADRPVSSAIGVFNEISVGGLSSLISASPSSADSAVFIGIGVSSFPAQEMKHQWLISRHLTCCSKWNYIKSAMHVHLHVHFKWYTGVISSYDINRNFVLKVKACHFKSIIPIQIL